MKLDLRRFEIEMIIESLESFDNGDLRKQWLVEDLKEVLGMQVNTDLKVMKYKAEREKDLGNA